MLSSLGALLTYASAVATHFSCQVTALDGQIALHVAADANDTQRDIVARLSLPGEDDRETQVLLERDALSHRYRALVDWRDLDQTVEIDVSVSAALGVDTARAANWSQTAHPAAHASTTALDCGSSRVVALRRSLAPPADAPCGWLTGREPTQYWFDSRRRWTPGGSCRYTEPTNDAISAIASCVLWLGDSQMRTTYESMVAQLCPDFRWADFRAHGAATSWCKRNVTLERTCSGGGVFSVVGGDGCWSGGAVLRCANGALLAYADVHNTNDARFVAWLAAAGIADDVRLRRRCIVLLASGLHDENNAVAESSFAAAHVRRLETIRQHVQPRYVVQVGAWASEPARRGGGFWWAAMPSRVAAMNRAVERAIADARFEPPSSVQFLDLFRMTLAVRDQTPDGVHLAQPHPLSAVASLLWHNVLTLLSTARNETL